MGEGYRMLGFLVIAILYLTIGLMAATGTIAIFRRIFTPRSEQIFYAMFLILIAVFYLAFVAYFGVTTAWRLEATAVGIFTLIGILGVRLPFALIIGYSLHGLWDFLHELQTHGSHAVFQPDQVTAIPLAYGFFCLAFDFCMAAYFMRRRAEWVAARKPAH